MAVDSQEMNADRSQDWREELRGKMNAKERSGLPRVTMPELPPTERITGFREVNSGLPEEMAVREAKRCLDCATPSCVSGCPVNINIPGFIKRIEKGDFLGAAQKLKETNALPAVCGRVCPQEVQCEALCVYQKMKKPPVAIGYLERFASDCERQAGAASATPLVNNSGMQVAAIGSGPASLTFAGQMTKFGCRVTVFEALHELAGVLSYGIPEFRLPKSIVRSEIAYLEAIGVRFERNVVVGKTLTIDDMKAQGYQGFFIGSGAGLPKFMRIPGENSIGIYSSNEYLTRVNLMKAYQFPAYDTPIVRGKRVAVVGGGNTAMDSVRTAVRLGAEKAMIVYRRSEQEMPARIEEVHHAKEEGVEFLTLTNPVEYLADNEGRVRQMKVQKMGLGAADDSGRRRPVAIVGSEYLIDVDTVVVGVGTDPNPLIPQSIQGLEVTKWGTIVVNEETMQTAVPEIFAGGDIVRGGATVILAMGDGKKAAESMHAFLLEKAARG
ncbi:MAG: NADPH-dependent glutamate synthase [Acidobacteria bacterium]|jgi:glutamate synthase (NADPH/NADH) small chain|nr:NADPH-dependent glutamate synthase [Acidobacteriota bacterium]